LVLLGRQGGNQRIACIHLYLTLSSLRSGIELVECYGGECYPLTPRQSSCVPERPHASG
jgi:hypothetical protein